MTIPISSPPRLLLANCRSSISHPTRYLQLRRVPENEVSRSRGLAVSRSRGLAVSQSRSLAVTVSHYETVQLRDHAIARSIAGRRVPRGIADRERTLHAVMARAAGGVRTVI